MFARRISSQITIIIFFLYLKLGVSAIIGAICCILIVTPMQLILGKRMSMNSTYITVSNTFLWFKYPLFKSSIPRILSLFFNNDRRTVFEISFNNINGEIYFRRRATRAFVWLMKFFKGCGLLSYAPGRIYSRNV